MEMAKNTKQSKTAIKKWKVSNEGNMNYKRVHYKYCSFSKNK